MSMYHLGSCPTSNRPPIGMALNRAARIVGRAFDEALTEAGGSLPVWLVLLNVETGQASTQRSLAAALGLREPTLSHHLAAMESDGLITRRRDDANRRVQVVALTDAGRARFRRLRTAAIAFDRSCAAASTTPTWRWSTRSSPGSPPTSADGRCARVKPVSASGGAVPNHCELLRDGRSESQWFVGSGFDSGGSGAPGRTVRAARTERARGQPRTSSRRDRGADPRAAARPSDSSARRVLGVLAGWRRATTTATAAIRHATIANRNASCRPRAERVRDQLREERVAGEDSCWPAGSR